MPGASLEDVWRLGAELPGVVNGTAYGSPALKVHDQLMACVPTNKSAETGSLMVRVDRGQRDLLVAEAPEIYYATDHYAGHDAVLVRLARLNLEVLRDLMAMAYRHVTKQKARRGAKRTP